MRDGVSSATDGPYVEAEGVPGRLLRPRLRTEDRVIELAAMIPDAKLTAIEVRPVMDDSGLEM